MLKQKKREKEKKDRNVKKGKLKRKEKKRKRKRKERREKRKKTGNPSLCSLYGRANENKDRNRVRGGEKVAKWSLTFEQRQNKAK